MSQQFLYCKHKLYLCAKWTKEEFLQLITRDILLTLIVFLLNTLKYVFLHNYLLIYEAILFRHIRQSGIDMMKSKVLGKGSCRCTARAQALLFHRAEFVTERGRSGLSYPPPKARPASVLKELETHGPQDPQVRFGSKSLTFMALSRPWMNPGQKTTALIRGTHGEGHALRHTAVCKRVGL